MTVVPSLNALINRGTISKEAAMISLMELGAEIRSDGVIEFDSERWTLEGERFERVHTIEPRSKNLAERLATQAAGYTTAEREKRAIIRAVFAANRDSESYYCARSKTETPMVIDAWIERNHGWDVDVYEDLFSFSNWAIVDCGGVIHPIHIGGMV